jgi:hypothetical protein
MVDSDLQRVHRMRMAVMFEDERLKIDRGWAAQDAAYGAIVREAFRLHDGE